MTAPAPAQSTFAKIVAFVETHKVEVAVVAAFVVGFVAGLVL